MDEFVSAACSSACSTPSKEVKRTPIEMTERIPQCVVFPRFVYTEIPDFQHEVQRELLRLRRSYRITREELTIADALDTLDSLPKPASRFAKWHAAHRGELLAGAKRHFQANPCNMLAPEEFGTA